MPKDDKCPYFPFYPDDFSSDGNVEAMTSEEVGAYTLLLCKAWREEPVGSVPNDDRILARWARMTTEQWQAAKAAVLAPFRLRDDGRLHQGRMEREYEKMLAARERRAGAGKKGASKRWGDHPPDSNANGNAIGLPSESHCETDAIRCLSPSSSIPSSSSPSTDSPKGESPPDGGAPARKPRGWSADEIAEGKAVLAAWNDLPDVPGVVPPMSEARKRTLRARLREAFWRANWRQGIERIAESDYCRGKVKDWSASFDWFIKPATLQKLIEGHYAPRGHPQRQQGGRSDAAFDYMQQFGGQE